MRKFFIKKDKASRRIVTLLISISALCLTSLSGLAAQSYTVKKGDNLTKIAKMYNLSSWRDIADNNELKNPNLIYPGQELTIPISDFRGDADTVELVILGTSDMHGNIWGYSYEDQKDTDNNGMARVSTYVNKVREETPNVVLIDNGDTIQWTILTDDLYNKRLIDHPHPVIKALNYMQYDSMILGNHEFNFGLDLIHKIVKEADFPILGANIKYKQSDESFVPPYTIVEKAGLSIGIIGVVTPNVPRWDGEKVDELYFENMAESVSKFAKELKEGKQVDLIVVAAHAGITPEFDDEGMTDSASSIPIASPYIDVMLIGHTHVSYSSNIGETIIGQPRNLARDVVRFDLSIDVSSDYSKVISKEVNIIDMEDYEPDDKLRETTRAEHEATLSFIIGTGDAVDGLDSGAGVFGTATQDFQPVNEIKSIPEGKLRDTAVVDLINKGQLEISNADVSAASLFQDTSDIGKGDITYGDVFNIYKFDNVLYTVDITGKELKNYMEWSASSYNIWKSGDINISFNEDRPGYLYDIFEGVDYKIDISKPVGSMIVDVMFKGEPLQDDQKLILAVNNYRYNSTLKSEGIVAGNKTWESPASIRDYIVEYINERGEISPEVNNNWKITGVDLDSPYRDEIIKMVNDGVLEVPYYGSLNVDELRAQGVI